MRTNNVSQWLFCLIICVFSINSQAQILLKKSVFSNGPVASSGSSITMNATIGQSTIGIATGNSFTTEIGFWNRIQNEPNGTQDENLLELYDLSISPNPYQGFSTVEFFLPTSSNVKIILVNSEGRFVRKLYDGVFTYGKNSLAIDTPLSPGIYFLYLATDKHLIKKSFVAVN